MSSDNNKIKNWQLSPQKTRGYCCRWLGSTILGAIVAFNVMAQPAQRPLLVNSTGAKPNLIVTLDNSASMAEPVPESYEFNYDPKSENTAQRLAIRSAEFNSLYYNPRIKYEPRVDAMGTPLVPDDDIVFVSNQNTVRSYFELYGKSGSNSLRNGENIYIKETAFPRQDGGIPSGWTPAYASGYKRSVPEHLTYTALEVNKGKIPAFTYAICQDNIRSSAGCTEAQVVNIQYDPNALIQLSISHKRGSDCPQSTESELKCTGAQEIRNILNWYRYYSTRIRATQTAIGQAFQHERLKNGLLRVGYMHINDLDMSNQNRLLGTDDTAPKLLRGVRVWEKGSTNNAQFFDWLYSTYPIGTTPLHDGFDRAAKYLMASAVGVKENPWAADPSTLTSNTNPELSCRRSYHVMFSDGAWSSDLQSARSHAGEDHDNIEGPKFPRGSATDASSEDFAYKPKGIPENPEAYIPYPGNGRGGLADLAAKYYWHTDFRPQLANDVSTTLGQPTYWQNMRSYTIGYLIQPSGEISGADAGLKFAQIDQYNADYLMKAASIKAPSWPSPVSGELTNASANQRIDDFIQAGYTGGGRGFSVKSADEIRSALDAIISDILDASGNDAGTAAGPSVKATAPLEGRLKYSVDYRTTGNAGDILARRLDASGNETGGIAWSAKALLRSYGERRVFSHTSAIGGFEFKGRFDLLPSDVRTALSTGDSVKNIPQDSSFVDYLRGKDPVADNKGTIYRLRSSRIGAIVNSAPVLTSDTQHMGYDDAPSTVDGQSSYAAFRDKAGKAENALFVPTNAGMVHAFNANSGQELAAFIPRHSMSRLLDQASPNATFQYVLDGPLSLQEAYNSSTQGWLQFLVGTGGRGARLVYGLRASINADSTRTPNASDFLWETGPDGIDTPQFATGYMTNEARSGQTEAGQWVVVLNSGHFNDRADGSGHGLVVLDAMSGEVIRTISLPALYPAGRGLGGVTLVRNAQKRIVAAYAGDANGQLWRFDLRGEPANWKVSYGKPLFQTPDKRPIYAGPAWQPHPKGGVMVIVATGILLDESDEADVQKREGIFGVWDPTSRTDGQETSGFETVNVDLLLEQTVIERQIGNAIAYDFTRNRIDWNIHRGWKLMLGGKFDSDTKKLLWSGERVIDQIRNVGSSVQVNSVLVDRSNPADDCTREGPAKNRFYVLNALDGVAKPTFDINNDGVLDVAMLLLDAGGFSRNIALVNRLSEAQMTPAQLRQSHFATNDGESDEQNTKCTASNFVAMGVSSNPVFGRITCSSTWSRQEYQLSEVPR